MEELLATKEMKMNITTDAKEIGFLYFTHFPNTIVLKREDHGSECVSVSSEILISS